MKPFDPTKRCRNCGGMRSEHRINGLHSCPTNRAAKGYWNPWTAEEYEQAENAAKAHRFTQEDADRVRWAPIESFTQEDMERARLYDLMRKPR